MAPMYDMVLKATGPMDDLKREYLASYEDWQAQICKLNRVLVEGVRMDPPKLKGLLNREARAWEHFGKSRRLLLGLTDDT
jgi:hypothetical protein